MYFYRTILLFLVSIFASSSLSGESPACNNVCQELNAIHAMDKLDLNPTHERADTILSIARAYNCDCLPDALNIRAFKYYSLIKVIESKKLLLESEKLLIEGNRFDKTYIDNQIFMALNHIMDKDYDLAILKLNRAKQLAIKSDLHKAVVNINSNLGLCYQQQGNYEKSTQYYEDIITNKDLYFDYDAYGYALENLSNINKDLNRYSKALDYNEQSLTFWKSRDHVRGQYFSYFHRAELLEVNTRYREQLNSLLKAQAIGDSNDISIVDLHIEKQIGNAYINLERRDSMVFTYEKILANHEAITPEDLSHISNHLSDYYLENKLAKKQKSLISALLENSKQVRQNNSEDIELLVKSYEVIDNQTEEVNQLNIANSNQKTRINRQYWFSGLLILALTLVGLYLRLVYNSNAYKRKTIKQIVSKNSELIELNEALDYKNEELEKFAYVTSHDIKGPLLTIYAMSKSVLNLIQNKEYDLIDQHMNFINSSSKNLIDLTDELLGHARMTKLETNKTRIDSGLLIKEIIDDLQESIREKGAVVTYKSVDKPIYSDKIKLRQILQNLISNSLKFSSQEQSPNVSITVEELDSQYQFKVKDNGIGIDPSAHSKIFEMFTSLEKKNKGTGIGLATVSKLVKALNGTIAVDSSLGHGSTFTINLAK